MGKYGQEVTRFLPWREISYLVACVMILLLSTASALRACEVVKMFTGMNLLSKASVPVHERFGGYDFLLVLNEERDENGILNAYIKGVLVPARWGFDVKLPNGKQVGQVMLHVVDPNLTKGIVEVTIEDDSCVYGDSVFFIKKGKEQILTTYRGTEIGVIINKYPEFWER